MPLRFVSLNTLFLQQLAQLGEGKAGWYRGTHMVGMFLIGPLLAARLVQSIGRAWTFRVIAAAFLLTVFVSPIVFGRYAAPVSGRSLRWIRPSTIAASELFRDDEMRWLPSRSLQCNAR
jgi:hypothetical protein